MSSQKRIEANRRNAQKSTGPRTPAGKAKSAQNATTHGFASLNGNPLHPACFLHMEDKEKFQELLDSYLATYSPQHRDELDLLGEAVYAKWRQQRLWIAETNQIEISIALNESELRRAIPTVNNQGQLANGLAKSENMLKLYLRYDAQLHRHYLRCLKELRDLQASRPPATPPDGDQGDPDDDPQDTPTTVTPNEPTPPATNAPVNLPNEPNRPAPTPETAPPIDRMVELNRLIDLSLGRIPS